MLIMPKQNAKQLLQSLAKDKLKNNLLANVLAISWGTDKLQTEMRSITTTKLFNNLVPLVQRHLDFKNIPPFGDQVERFKKETIEHNDYRIGSIRASSIRGIPASKDSINNYGFDLKKEYDGDTLYQSAIILGANGSGKSSIFSGIEYIFTGEVSEAKLRYYRDPNYDKYLNNVISPHEKYFEIRVAGDNTYNLSERICDVDNLVELANPSSSFVSDYDIYHFGYIDYDEESEESFHKLFAKYLGIGDLIECNDYVKFVKEKSRSGRKKEKDDYNKNKKRQIEIRNNISSWRNEIDRLKEEISKLSTEKEAEVDDKFTNKITSLISMMKSHQYPALPEIKHIEDIFDSYSDLYVRIGANIKDNINQDEILFLDKGLELLIQKKSCPFCLSSRKGYEDIKDNVETRIISAKEFIRLNQSLSQTFWNISDIINEILIKLQELKLLLDSEIKALSSIAGNEDVISQFREYLNILDDILSSRELEDLNDVLKKSTYDPISQKKLYYLITDDNYKWWSRIKEVIKLYSNIINNRNHTIDNLLKLGPSEEMDTISSQVERRKIQIEQREKEIAQNEREYNSLKTNEEHLEAAARAVEYIESDAPILYDELEKYVSNILESLIKPLKSVIVEVLNVFFDDVDIDIEIKETEDKNNPEIIMKRLNVILVDNKTQKKISPKIYLNTSRYRVFCGALAIGISLATRKRSEINLPLILDDEFFAADIINRSRAVEYIKNIILSFRSITPELPFQFILFTHDELVYDCAKEAINQAWVKISELNGIDNEEIDKDWKIDLNRKMLFSRLFPATDSEESPTISIFGDKYWNLLINLDEISINISSSEHITV
jgi:hypothetical protein